ncbi:hypothetical protein TNCV_2804091 [Trichonephila clavipes]|nr:hypothetical protein TNCV_2804091 [Trichonephila clavipes]
MQEKNNSTRQHERNNSFQQEKTTQLGNMNETTQQEKTTQLGNTNEITQLSSRNETTQLVSRNETTQLCTAVDRLHRLYSRICFFYHLCAITLGIKIYSKHKRRNTCIIMKD